MYIRVIENCHLGTAHPKFKDTERNSLFCPTRFVAQADAKAVPQDVLDNQTLEDGSKAPVILIGHCWNFDEHALKKEFNLSTPKLEGIVFEIKSLGRLAEQAGIIAAPKKALGESYPNFDHMLKAGFMINWAGTWRHNGANNAVYQMTLAFLIALFPLLYPNTASGSYPSDPTIEGQTINEIWQDLARYKDTATSRYRLRALLFLLRDGRRPRCRRLPNKVQPRLQLLRQRHGITEQAIPRGGCRPFE
jgi:hypothetical protein